MQAELDFIHGKPVLRLTRQVGGAGYHYGGKRDTVDLPLSDEQLRKLRIFTEGKHSG